MFAYCGWFEFLSQFIFILYEKWMHSLQHNHHHYSLFVWKICMSEKWDMNTQHSKFSIWKPIRRTKLTNIFKWSKMKRRVVSPMEVFYGVRFHLKIAGPIHPCEHYPIWSAPTAAMRSVVASIPMGSSVGMHAICLRHWRIPLYWRGYDFSPLGNAFS